MGRRPVHAACNTSNIGHSSTMHKAALPFYTIAVHTLRINMVVCERESGLSQCTCQRNLIHYELSLARVGTVKALIHWWDVLCFISVFTV